MANMTVKIDVGDAAEVMAEIGDLWRDGAGVPMHLCDRTKRMFETCARGEGTGAFLTVDLEKRTVTAGHELLSILATLRAVRGVA